MKMLVTVCLAVVCAVTLVAQQPQVRFKSEVNFVEIDAIVTDRSGKFVAGLTKDDFQIVEEGKPQQIVVFEMVHIPVTPPAAAAAVPRETALVAPDAISNEQSFEGRIFLLVLDDLQTGLPRTPFVKKAAQEFIERHVGPHDLVAVAFTSAQSLGQDFTTARARLSAAIDRFAGTKLQSATGVALEDFVTRKNSTPEDVEVAAPSDTLDPIRTLRAKTSLGVLQQLSEFLGGVRGRRKTLVYFGEGIDYDMRELTNTDPKAIPGMTITRDTGGIREAMRDVFSAATRNNVSIYVVDPRGLSTGADEAIGLPTSLDPVTGNLAANLADEMNRSHLSLRAMAEVTGGIAFLNTNNTSEPLARIVEDSSSFYILGYYAPVGRADGRFRRVDVRLKREGLRVRARQGYYAPRSDARPTTALASSGASADLVSALKSPIPVADLAFSASAAPFRGNGATASVALVVEFAPGSLKFTESGGSHNTDVEVYVSASDPLSAKKHVSNFNVAELRLRAETYESVAREGVRITRRMDLPPGRYRVQVGVRDGTSRAVGTVFTDLEVPDLSSSSLGMSGIVMVSAAGTRTPTVSPDAILDAHLPGAHTARRAFPLNDTLAIFAEIYGDSATVMTTVTGEEGQVLFRHTEQRPKEHANAGGDMPWPHRVTIPAVQLGVGRFVLRMEAASASGRTIARALPFAVN